MIKGAVFDMDGLMFDSEKLTYKSWQAVMDKYGFKYDLDTYKSTVGLRTVEVKKMYKAIYGSDFDYDTLRAEANEHFWSYISNNGMPVKKGLKNMLQYLKEQNIKIALATSTTSDSAKKMLDTAQVTKYFDKLICGDMVKNSKPHPEVFLTAANELSVKPCDCVAFEDSINGIKSAYFSGMKPVMVPDMIAPVPEIEPMIFALCIDLDQAIDVIKALLNHNQ